MKLLEAIRNFFTKPSRMPDRKRMLAREDAAVRQLQQKERVLRQKQNEVLNLMHKIRGESDNDVTEKRHRTTS